MKSTSTIEHSRPFGVRPHRVTFGLLAGLVSLAACSSTEKTETVGHVTQGISTGVVISQVYGGGGNSGAPITRDFVELFNRGSSPVDVTGWSIQYGGSNSAIGSSGSNIVTLPAATIQPGKYYLIALAAGTSDAAAMVDISNPDFAGTLNLGSTGGKVALVNDAVGINCGATAGSCAGIGSIVDLVGYGSVSDSEGSPAPATSNTTAVVRLLNGCKDTDDNAADFVAESPQPHSSGSPGDFRCTLDAGSDASVDASADAGSDVTVVDAAPDVFVDAANEGGNPEGGLGPSPLLISQFYGGGGNSGATLNRDYVELFNRGRESVSLAGLALMYGGASKDFGTREVDGATPDTFALPDVMLAPGAYFLVGLASTSSTVGSALPAVDAEGTLALSATNGKLALVSGTDPLSCGGVSGRCGDKPRILDLVGYGSGTDFEGAALGVLSNTTAAIRARGGCADTNNNLADFTIDTPNPRNTSTPLAPCSLPVDGGPDDAARPVDANLPDGLPPKDAAPDVLPPRDAGPDVVLPPKDAAPDVVPPPRDAGPPPVDVVEPPPFDANIEPPPVDASKPKDAGKKDSGANALAAENNGGCAISPAGQASSHGLIGLALSFIAFASRRRRHT